MAYTILIDLGTPQQGLEKISSKTGGNIEAQSLTWGAARAVVGSSLSGAGGRVQLQELHFTKFVDSATPTLLSALSGGKSYAQVTITIRKDQAATSNDTTITLKDVTISSIEGSADGVDAPIEDIGLLFSMMNVAYGTTTGGLTGESDDWDTSVSSSP